MYVRRVPCAGGFLYRVYANDATHRVARQGTLYLQSIGWHPELSAFVSTSDDEILWRHSLIETAKKKTPLRRGVCFFGV